MPKHFRLVSLLVLALAAGFPAGAIVEASDAPNPSGWVSFVQGVGDQSPVVANTSETQEGITVTITVPGVLLASLRGADGVDYVSASLVGCGETAEEHGLPVLPFKGLMIEIPYGVEAAAEVRLGAATTIDLSRRVFPLQPPQAESGPDEAFILDAAAYQEDALQPGRFASLEGPSTIRGRRLLFLKVFPVQYNPAAGQLIGYDSVTVHLSYQGQINELGELRKAQLATPQSEKDARRLLVNYEPPQPVMVESGGDMAEPNGTDYLVIVADQLYEEVQPLTDWKRTKGFHTRVVRMSEVGTTSVDVQDYVQTAYDTWVPAPQYLLLVGDVDQIPASYYSGTLECYSDLPYVCVDGSDYYPDIIAGRIPVQTEQECAVVVDKILDYERAIHGGEWCGAFLSAGYFQDTDNFDAVADRYFMETSAHVLEYLDSVVGMTVYTAWCKGSLEYDTYYYRVSSYPHRFPHPDAFPEWIVSLWTTASQATSDIFTALNAGVGLVLHRNHGSQTRWSHPPFSTTDIASLANGSQTPVVLSINCESGSFHRSAGDCFCEAFLKRDGGGAVGVVGATRNSYSGYNDLLTHGMMTCFWPDYDPSHTGNIYTNSWRVANALNFGKYYMLIYKGTTSYTAGEFHMFHWFGDPEMMLRTRTPQPVTVDHPSALPYQSPTPLTLTVAMDGVPLEGARAAITHSGSDELWTGLTDPNGVLTLPGIHLSEQEGYTLTVTAHNAIPYVTPLMVIPSPVGNVTLDRTVYSCASVVTATVADGDLVGAGTQEVTASCDGGDVETMVLTESPQSDGVFTGTIATSGDPVNPGDGTLQVGDGATLTVRYNDLDDGSGQPAVSEATAGVDCAPPNISNVQIERITGSWVEVSFQTDTESHGRVLCGPSCGEEMPYQGESAGSSTSHTIRVSGLSPLTEYVFIVEAEDLAGNLATDDNGGSCYPFATTEQIDYFTQWFDSETNDLSYRTLLLTPDGSVSYYSACVDDATEYFVDPNGGTVLNLDDNSSLLVILQDGKQVRMYGESSPAMIVGSNGYLTAPSGDSNPIESFANHFNRVRISAFFDDLDPSSQGTVSWRQLEDRFALTYDDVPEAGTSNSNNVQVEMFFDGRLRITWLRMDAEDGLVGLSWGEGIPEDFVESDISAYAACTPSYSIDIDVNSGDWGTVVLTPPPDDPNEPTYPEGTVVSLWAQGDDEDRVFEHWVLFDPNHPSDMNYAVLDMNNPLVLTLDRDYEVRAVFKCGTLSDGSFIVPPFLVLLLAVARRRRRL